MVFKSWSSGSYSYEPVPINPSPRQRENRVDGDLILRVGNIKEGRVSRNRNSELVERVNKIDDNLLGYNVDGKHVLIRTKKNERKFDQYVSLPFVKGLTERETGRTLLIAGSDSHHGDAMLFQFNGVIWTPNLEEDLKKYGNTMRWINVGDTRQGFIGLDYNSKAEGYRGVANSLKDIKFLSSCLLEYGYSPKKKLFILKPPYIVESEEGKSFRNKGLETLLDYSKVK